MRLGILALGLSLGFSCLTADVAEVARRLLDDKTPQKDREAIVNENKDQAAELVKFMTDGLKDQPVAGKEEYRRIPWIWRCASGAGKRNDGNQLVQLLEIGLPQMNEPLRDWRVVVCGGGVVGGLSTGGQWPKTRVAELLKGMPPEVAERWNRAVELALAKVDDEKVHKDTRYDCLRLSAMGPEDKVLPLLKKYLAKEIDPELQQGAICGLSDIESDQVAGPILDALIHFQKESRDQALTALLRTESRANALLDRIEGRRARRAWLGAEHLEKLKHHKSEAIRARAAKLLQR